MGRKPAPQPLTLPSDPTGLGDEDQRPGETLQVSSPVESRSPRSPRSPFRFSPKKSQTTVGGPKQPMHVAELVQQQVSHEESQYPPISSAIHQSYEPPTVQQQRGHSHHRQEEEKASKSGFFFNFSKSSKSSDRLQTHQYSDSTSDTPTMSRGSDHPAIPDQSSKHSDPSYIDQQPVRKPVPSIPSKSDVSLASSTDYDHGSLSNYNRKGGKPKPFTILGRTRSVRDKDSPSPKEATAPKISESERANTFAPLKTAPVPHDRSFRDMMSSAARNHSADRAQPRDVSGTRGGHNEKEYSRTQPSSYKDNNGPSFFSGFKSSRAADMISKGLFGKGTRSGSTTEREPVVDDEHYVLKVINLPLVEQARLTRISKRLEDSRDKTEFWMPAFPWRAIDYLNYKGCDVEGLYRVPGSGPQIKKWQRKFDEQYDVDLFNQDDLYDINIIGSMLKAWLRELPDELFPKEAQERIARECAGSETVPQMLVDELSNLSPFNYYLLFAITCHLSLLLAHSDKNKMDFRNLCICFQPCMKIDAFSFKFLVCDWRDCWKGCKNEAKFIEEEYMLFDQPPPRGLGDPRRQQQEEAIEDRNVSSSDSSKQSTHQTPDHKSRLKKKNGPQGENGSVVSNNSTISTTLTINSGQETPPRRSGDLRPLSPIKPLSPLGF